MIVNYANVLNHCQKDAASYIEQLHKSLESWIKSQTGHDWEENDYVEFCTAKGSQLELDHYPVYKIVEIAAITSGIQIKNTSTDSRNAYVSIDSDSLDLAVIGGDNVMTATLAFADYATLTLMVSAINDEGKGWEAELYSTAYASYPSSALMEINNFFCGASRGVAPSYRNLEMLDTPYDGYTCDEDIGVVYRDAGWARGRNQVIAKYSAYNVIPEDIKGAVLNGVKFMVTQHEEGTIGLENYSNADLSATFEQVLPSHILDTVRLHSKVM